MAQFFFLDAGPLMLACRWRGPTHTRDAALFAEWRMRAQSSGSRIIVPAVADFEVRRKLIHLGDRAALVLLDDLIERLSYLEIAPGVMKAAAELWAWAKSSGRPIGDDRGLGADAILAAQVQLYCGVGDRATVITENRDHLSFFVDARSWRLLAR